MSFIHHVRRIPLWTLGAGIALLSWLVLPRPAGSVDAGNLWMVGPQAWSHPDALATPRVSVFEADGWRHSLKDGSLQPVPRLALKRDGWIRANLFRRARRTDLLHGANFTAGAYLARIEALQKTYSLQRDILMYYGGIRRHPNPEGLNFNGWSGHDLKKLRALGGRPFIGLETMDRAAIRALIWRLKEAGYGPMDRIYVRIGAEPGYSAYGTEDGTPKGRRRTAAAYAAYRQRFARTSEYLNALNRRHRLNLHTVFAGASREDFSRYQPPAFLFDAIGYDLYLTPENKTATLQQVRALCRRYPFKPMVIPELGIATDGPSQATPRWAEDALGEVLMELGRRPGGVQAITVFSVNVSGRISDRRWNWAWTPKMYEMLKEWQASPRRWRKDGFHRYDPLSYPMGRNVLFLNGPEARVVVRRLAASKAPGIPLFQETCFVLRRGVWTHHARVVYFTGSKKRPHRHPAALL